MNCVDAGRLIVAAGFCAGRESCLTISRETIALVICPCWQTLYIWCSCGRQNTWQTHSKGFCSIRPEWDGVYVQGITMSSCWSCKVDTFCFVCLFFAAGKRMQVAPSRCRCRQCHANAFFWHGQGAPRKPPSIVIATDGCALLAVAFRRQSCWMRALSERSSTSSGHPPVLDSAVLQPQSPLVGVLFSLHRPTAVRLRLLVPLVLLFLFLGV